MSRPWNQHCDNCIGALSSRSAGDDSDIIPTASDSAADAQQTGRYVHRLQCIMESGVLDDGRQAACRLHPRVLAAARCI